RDQTGNDFYDILNKIISDNCLLHWIKNERIRKILPGGETWLEELASIVQLVLTRNDSTCMKIAVMCLNLTINANIKWKNDKIQSPLNILPTYINLANCVLGSEYVSIYVKYCYLDALVLLIQTFLEWTP
ncbi:unnamed protein product, partial [Adineta steineri]